MEEIIKQIQSPLFEGIDPEDREAMLACTGYHVDCLPKGSIIALEADHIRHIGVVISGVVDMVKEDVWGNKTILVRMKRNDLFGETFACGRENASLVTFLVTEEAKILFIPFHRVMHSCTNACIFHQQLIENMVRVIADKNRDLMQKMDVITKRTIREKLLAYLSIQAQIHGSSCFEIPLNRTELADYLCADRSALTRELAKMKQEGLMDYDKNWFQIKA